MIKLYTLSEEGVLQIREIPFNDAVLICQNDMDTRMKYKGIKFITLGEFTACSSMTLTQRKLFYELKEN